MVMVLLAWAMRPGNGISWGSGEHGLRISTHLEIIPRA